MARFHVYQLGSEPAIDLQANLLDGLNTRVMAPLVPETDVKRLVNNPRFNLNGTIYVMMREFLASVPSAELGTQVADLSDHRDRIIDATDFLFQGF